MADNTGYVLPITIDSKQARKDIDKFAKDTTKELSNAGDVDIKVKVDDSKVKKIKKDIDGLKDTDVKVNVDDSDVETTKKKLKDLDDTVIKPTVELPKLELPKLELPKFDVGGSGLGGLTAGFTSLLNPMALATAGVAALGAGFVALINEGYEVNILFEKLQAKTGATAEEMERYKESSKDLFTAGVGESLSETITILGDAKRILGDTFTTEGLDTFVAGANSLAKVMDKDVNEVLRNSKTFADAFGLSGEKAFELIAYGSQNANTPADDLLETLNEFSVQFKGFGLGAEDSMKILELGADAGARSLDKVADAIFETNLRIGAGDYQSAFKGLGESAKGAEKDVLDNVSKIADAFRSEEISGKEFFKKFGDELKNSNISDTFKQELVIGISGTPAEELGKGVMEEIIQGFSDADTSGIGKAGAKAASEFTEAAKPKGLDQVFRELKLQFSVIGSELATAFAPIIESLGDFLIPLIKGLVKVFKGLIPIVKLTLIPLRLLGSIVGTLYEAIEPLIIVIGTLLVGAFEKVNKWITSFTNGLSKIIDGVKSFFTIVKDEQDIEVKVGFDTTQMEAYYKELHRLQAGDQAEYEKNYANRNLSLKFQVDTTKALIQLERVKQGKQTASSVKEFLLKKGLTAEILKQQITEKLLTAEQRTSLLNALQIKKVKKDTTNLTKEEIKITDDADSKKLSYIETLNKQLKEETDELTKQLRLGKLNTDEYIKKLESIKLLKQKIKEFDEIKAQIKIDTELDAVVIIETNMETAGGFDGFDALRKEFETPLVMPEVIGLDEWNELMNKTTENSEKMALNIQNSFDLIGNTFKELGHNLSDGNKSITESFKDFGKSLISGSIDVLDSMVNIWSAQILGQALASPESIATFGVAGFAKAGLIIALLKAGIGGLKGAVGAEEGGEITENYNKKPGKTDTIPIMLAPNEFVVNAVATKENKELLTAINSGQDLSNFFVNPTGKLENTMPNNINNHSNYRQNTSQITNFQIDYKKLGKEIARATNDRNINITTKNNVIVKDKRLSVISEQNWR